MTAHSPSLRRKSQIQTFLEQNEGPGLQHLALKTADIFSTVRRMKTAEENFCGFELMKRPSDDYYRTLPSRLGDKLSVRMIKSFDCRDDHLDFSHGQVSPFLCGEMPLPSLASTLTTNGWKSSGSWQMLTTKGFFYRFSQSPLETDQLSSSKLFNG